MSHPDTRIARIALLLVLVLAAAPGAHAGVPLLTVENGVPTLAPLLRKVTPAVVNISVTTHVQTAQNPLLQDPFFRHFFNLPEQQQQTPSQPQQAVGSGVIVDAKKGYVITNHHVIKDADKVVVTLKDRRSFDAKVIGSDTGTDIALLKIDAKDLTALPLGDSDKLQVGDLVVAIGNPFGLGQTVTSGIVSALGRSGLHIEGYEDFIQTDASINPGNSGGALVNLKGQLVGINTAIIGPAGGNVGIGFAVPVNMVASVMHQLIKYGEVRRGQIGVFIQDLTPDLAQALQIKVQGGAVVTKVEPGSPAADADIRPADVIVAVDGKTVRSASDLRNHIGLVRVGKNVKLSILRDGKPLTIEVAVRQAQSHVVKGSEAAPQLAGATFRDIDSSNPLHGQIEGVQVASVEQGSPAWQSGLRGGDVVTAVNRRDVRSVKEFNDVVKHAGRVIALSIVRGDTRLFIVIQ